METYFYFANDQYKGLKGDTHFHAFLSAEKFLKENTDSMRQGKKKKDLYQDIKYKHCTATEKGKKKKKRNVNETSKC